MSRASRKFFYAFFEGGIIFSAVLLAAGIRFRFDPEMVSYYNLLIYKTLVMAVVCEIGFYYTNLYDVRISQNLGGWFAKYVQSLAVISLLLFAVYFLFPWLIIGRGIFLITMVLMTFALPLWRYGFERVLQIGPFKESVLIVGSGLLAKRIGRELIDHHPGEFEIVGFIDENRDRVGETVINPKVIGHVDSLADIARAQRVTRVIVAMPDGRGKLPVTPLLQCKFNGIDVEDGVTFYEGLMGKILVDHLKPSWFIFSSGFKQPRLVMVAKRGFDIVVSFAALLVCVPLFGLVALAVRLESPGPALFRQKRVGAGGRIFTLLKFRSMGANAERETGPVWALQGDQRVTRLGRWLRKCRVDEIPQLINVLRGDMSFVGPRPERPYFVAKLKKVIPFYGLRHSVRPGITGWAQIKYPYGATVEDASEKLQFDLFYIKNLSLWLDLVILLQTIKVVLIGKGAR